MRNLKKLLAVIVSVCVLATFALPAFAAETTKTDAEICELLGVLKGDTSEGVSDAYLAKGTSRMQAALLYLRLIGKEDEALAYESEDNFADADQTWESARPVLAYLKAHPELGWEGIGGDKFNPKGAASAQMIYKVCLEALGYKQGTDFEWADVFTFAAGKGLTKIADVTELTNENMATALVEVLQLKTKDGDKTLIEKLVADGVVTEAAAIDAGLIAATPDELEIESVTADNLIQAVVTFNQKVDKETATDKDNYDFANADKITVADASLQDDGVSVVLTFAAAVKQQKTAKLTVNNVKSAEGVKMEKTTIEVSFLDSTIPSVVSAEVIGISAIKVTFSEPMDPATVTAAAFKVNDGKYYVKGAKAQNNNTEFIVELYTSLKDGDLPFEMKAGIAEDYAGFTTLGYSATLSVNEDKEAPYVVSYEDAKPYSVTLIWNEDISFISKDHTKYYHTNSSNPVSVDPVIDGNKMTLTFDKDHKLPNGTAYVYVLKEVVKDFWNNKNAQQMTALDIVVDKDAPVLQSIDVKAEDKIVLIFDEAVEKYNKTANYTILDKDGKEIKNILYGVPTVDSTGKKVTVTFTKKLDGGDHTIVVKDIEDKSGNAMSSTSMSFSITDKTAPDVTKINAKLYTPEGSTDKVLKVFFPEAMDIDGTYGVNDLAKYFFLDGGAGGTVWKAVKDIDDVEIAVVDDAKAVEITFTQAALTKAGVTLAAGANVLRIARIADAAGNYTADLQKEYTIAGSGSVTISKAELTGAKEVKVYFSDELAYLNEDEIVIKKSGTVNPYTETPTLELKDGKSVATFKCDKEFAFNASDLTVTAALPTGATVYTTVNRYGDKLTGGAVGTIVDKLAPEIDKVVFVNKALIKVYFKENLEADTFASTGKNGFDALGGDLATAALVAPGTDGNVVLLTSTKDGVGNFTTATGITYNGTNITDTATDPNALKEVTKSGDDITIGALTIVAASTPDNTFTVTNNFDGSTLIVGNIDMDPSTSAVDSTVTINGITYTASVAAGTATITGTGTATAAADATTANFTITIDGVVKTVTMEIPAVASGALVQPIIRAQ